MMHNAIRDAISAGTPTVALSPAPNWADIAASNAITPAQQMLGIDSPITLRITTSAMPVYTTVTVYIGTSSDMTKATAYGIALGIQTTFVVRAGMWVAFMVDEGGNGVVGTINVANMSNGAVVLDTININITP